MNTAFKVCAFLMLPANQSTIATANAQGNPQDRPVETVRKNIQVLRGLPASQLFSVMNFVSASLGVRCNYCHVNNGGDNWVWDSDAKPSKRAARRMMQMVIALNKTGQTDSLSNTITCYTCHRGQTRPQHIPGLPLVTSEDAERAGEVAAPVLPTVMQIMNKYVQAVGGPLQTAKLQTRVLRGTRESSQGDWPLEIKVKQPDKFVLTVTVPEQGVIQQGMSGGTAWLKNAREQRLLSGPELAVLQQTAALYEPVIVKVDQARDAWKVTGIAKVAGRDVYLLESANPGDTVEKLYFDVETGLLVRRLTLTTTILAPIPEQIDFEDYRDVDGLKIPFVIRISEIDPYFNTTRRFTDIRHNVPIDDAVFRPPAGAR